MSKIWEIFEQIGAAKQDSSGNLDPKVDSLMSAAVERISDGLASMGQDTLREGADAARAALDRLEDLHPIDSTSVAFIGGRLASTADLLGFAASRAAQDGAAALAQRAPYAQTLSQLAQHPLRNVDLGAKLNKSEAQICRILRELRSVDLVTPQKRGREVFNVLTPIGRMIVEDGVQQMHRAPLEKTNIIDFAANRTVSLERLTPCRPIQGSDLPRLASFA